MPKPSNVKELQVFLGMLNFYNKFIKNYTNIMNPFVKLLREDIVWSWSRECEAAFQKAKASLASYDVLTYFDPNLPVKLTCDPSPVGVGAVISHRINGIDRPIAYASKTLSAAERNYSQLDKEALALIFGVKHFH